MSEAQDKINALWNASAETYDATPGHGISDPREEAAWTETLRGLLPPPPCDVLDVGCGTGFLSLLLARLGHRVRGIDLADKMLVLARENAGQLSPDIVFEHGDAIEPPGAPDSTDAVVNRHLFWTLTDPERALQNWLQLLRPGGRLLVIDGLWGKQGPDPRLGNLADSLPMIRVTSLGPVLDLVRRAGFIDVQIRSLSKVERVELELHGQSDEEPRYALTAAKPA